MNLRIVLGKKIHKNFLSSSLNNLFSLNEILIQGDKDISIINISDNEKLIIAGRIVGIRKSRDSLEKIEINTEKFIKFIQNKSIKSLISIIEGRYIFAKIDGNDIEIATDRYGQIDMYYKTDSEGSVFSSNLDLINLSNKITYDQSAVFHSLYIWL